MPHLEISQTDQRRLAEIRAQMEKWAAIYPESRDWDSAFLIKKIDELKQRVG